MNQVPCIPISQAVPPQYIPVQQPVQQPNYNAVKIDIINPTAGAPLAPQPQYQQVTAPIYNYPQAPVYNYPPANAASYPQQPQFQQPVAPTYNYPTYTMPGQYPPVCIPQYPGMTPAPQVANAPASQYPQPLPADNTQIQQPQVTAQTPVVTQPAVIEQQNINAPVAQQPVPVQQTVQNAEVPAPQVSAPEIVPPVAVEPKLDVNEFVAKLANPDFEVQAATMEDIATIIKDRKNPQNPQGIQAARTLVDSKIYDELNNIINFDSSKLDGPTQAQIDARQKILSGKKVSAEEEKLANTMTPKEQAERNKSYALFTLAIMDELYADEVSHLPDSSMPPLTELPKINVMVDQLKDNPNPMVRSSAIEALSYIQTPEYKKDLETLFTVAKNDKDAGVAQSAAAALEKLNQV